MEKFKNMLVIFLVAGVVFSANAQKTVATDERLDVDFDQYETYTWASFVNGAKVSDFLNDAILKSTIKDAVAYEMEARGYDQTTGNADLMVNFRVFEEPTEFQGYTGHQEVMFNDEVRERESIKTYNLQEGTLLVQLVDIENNEVVWQGYASGIMDNDVFDKDPEHIKKAVEEIFERYDYSAETDNSLSSN